MNRNEVIRLRNKLVSKSESLPHAVTAHSVGKPTPPEARFTAGYVRRKDGSYRLELRVNRSTGPAFDLAEMQFCGAEIGIR